MMAALQTDFEDRRRQVRHYLSVVVTAERYADVAPRTRAKERRLLTLRAGTFLILYNLIEATIRGAVQAVHDQITTEQATFETLTVNLRTEVTRRFRRVSEPSIDPALGGLASRFVAVALEGGIQLGGNVDARYIRKLAECYGFSHIASDMTRGGSDLLVIKNRRNDLAHGILTYEEVGRDYPASDLIEITKRSMKYVEDILRNISLYMQTRAYLTVN